MPTWRHTAHDELLRSCDTRSHCDWLRGASESEPPHPGRDLLWWNFARCAMPSDAHRFESKQAPIDSLVRYYKLRRPPPTQYSDRLETWVRQLVEKNDVRPLRTALRAYQCIDLPVTGETLIEMASQAGGREIRFALGAALRSQSYPKARKLGEQIGSEEAAWRAEDRARRGRSMGMPSLPIVRECGPVAWAPPPAHERRELHPTRERFWIGRQPGFFEDEESRLLRDLILFLQPDLDSVVIEERWPAVDRLPVASNAVPVQVFVNGDGVILPLPPPRNGQLPEFTETFREQVEEALQQERNLDAYLKGERWSVSFLPDPKRLAAVEVVSLVNALLEAADRPSRLRILSLGENLEVERQSIR